ncbi:MAG: DUF2490 domain-containing protein [Bacteroidetes bacterium]|nr:DUF2490 domain-containing protein [Bacteroidota bacterium]
MLRADVFTTYSAIGLWGQASVQYGWGSKWALQSDLHYRVIGQLNNSQQFVWRTFANYKLGNRVELALGHSYLRHLPYLRILGPVTTPEHNTWTQLLLTQPIVGRLAIKLRMRYENRFLGIISGQKPYIIEGFTFSNRLRIMGQLAWDWERDGLGIFQEAYLTDGGETRIKTSQYRVGVQYVRKFNSQFSMGLVIMEQWIGRTDWYDEMNTYAWVSATWKIHRRAKV